MKAQIIFIASIICLTLTLTQVDSTKTYRFIGKCRADQIEDDNYRHLTFICDSTTWVENDCFFYEDYSDTYVKPDVQFYKSAIRKIDFENCDQPTIFDGMFRDFFGVNDLDMSYLGMTTEQIRFLAQPNNLTQIDASHNNIAAILSDTFPVQNSIEFLNLSFNNITKLTANGLHCLKKIDRLILSNNRISKVPAFLFHTMARLTDLDLSSNNICKFYKNAFLGVKNLKKLDLSHNYIDKLPLFLLDGTVNLLELNVSFNYLGKIGSKAFPIVYKLRRFDASHSNIYQLDSELFQRFFHMERMNLAHNEIIHLHSNLFSQMRNLVELDLSFNRIWSFYDSALSGNIHLEQLYLNQNEISELTQKMFVDLVQLKHLNLSQNLLTKIEFGTFSTLENLKTLDLSENRLTTFDLNMFPTQPSQMFKALNISDNGLKELLNFTCANTPNIVISGIDNNQINCTHFKDIFTVLTSEHLDSYAIIDNCSPSDGNCDESETTQVEPLELTTEITTEPPSTEADSDGSGSFELIDTVTDRTHPRFIIQ